MIDLKKGGAGAVDEDGIGLGRIGEQLADLGFNAFDPVTNELKDLGTIIDELGEGWDDLTDKEKMNVAQVVGGKRQYTDFLTLMNNWNGKYKSFLSSATSEDGSAIEQQFETYAKGLDALQADAKNAWTSATKQLITPELLKGLAQVSTFVGNIFGDLTSAAGGFAGIAGMLSGALLKNFMPQIVSFGDNIQNSFKGSGNAMLRLLGIQSTAEKEAKAKKSGKTEKPPEIDPETGEAK
jgi:hypothetical protein